MTEYRPTPADVEWMQERSETDQAFKRTAIDLLAAIARKPTVVVKR